MRAIHEIARKSAGWIALLAMVLSWTCAASEHREWTVMVYMNAKNNLEPHALDNFHSMASVGSSKDVAIVAELGRPSITRYTDEDGNWSGVYRFYVTHGLKPLPANAVGDVKALGQSTDMGSPAALRDFISWAKATYPARKYMLVIWNHGQGWRFQLANSRSMRISAASGRLPAAEAQALPLGTPSVGGYRAVSSDDDTGSILFNREVQDVVKTQFTTSKLDLLGFDACLMGMNETAYAFSPLARVMVASEELEPGAGWKYSAWLTDLTKTPSMTSEQLGAAVVGAYKSQYADEYLTTLSVIRLENIRELAKALSTLSDAIREAGDPELNALRAARKSLKSYGASTSPPLRTSVDLITLLNRYEQATKSAELKRQSQALRQGLSEAILKNYASSRSAAPPSRDPYGSTGIAIYFPESLESFYSDYYHQGYLKSNKDRPVDFVVNETWADLLYKALGVPSSK